MADCSVLEDDNQYADRAKQRADDAALVLLEQRELDLLHAASVSQVNITIPNTVPTERIP
jgi:hypothetical protein